MTFNIPFSVFLLLFFSLKKKSRLEDLCETLLVVVLDQRTKGQKLQFLGVNALKNGCFFRGWKIPHGSVCPQCWRSPIWPLDGDRVEVAAAKVFCWSRAGCSWLGEAPEESPNRSLSYCAAAAPLTSVSHTGRTRETPWSLISLQDAVALFSLACMFLSSHHVATDCQGRVLKCSQRAQSELSKHLNVLMLALEPFTLHWLFQVCHVPLHFFMSWKFKSHRWSKPTWFFFL